jgi:3-methyladenine DNA glycosylase/8-oxoguanine DNA glycosylase
MTMRERCLRFDDDRRWGPLDVQRSFGTGYGPRDPSSWRDDDALWRAGMFPSGPATLRVPRAPTVDGSGDAELVVRAWGPGADEALELAPGLIGLYDEPHALTPRHPIVRDAQQQHRGLRLARGRRVTEVLIFTIIGQRVTSGEAHDSYRSMVLSYGERAPGPLRLKLPPEPERLRRPYYELARHGLDRGRAETVAEACFHARKIDALRSVEAPQAVEFLLKIRGIGPWTASSTIAVSHGWADAVIDGDYHLPHLVSWALAREPRGDDARMRELLEPYRGQRYRVLRLLALSGVAAPRFGPRRAPFRHWMRRR